MITVFFNKDRFFYDVHSLVKAFYPREEVCCLVRGTKEHCPDENSILLEVELHEEQGEIAVTLTPAGSTAGEARTERTQCIPLAAGERVSSIDTEPVLDARGERQYNAKNALKRLLYRMLSGETGKHLPWGSLTGIRPTHIPRVLLAVGQERESILKELTDTYFVSEKKAGLALEIAEREKRVLAEEDYAGGYSLYIGIPFCPTTCLYCSFPSYPLGAWESRVDDYLATLAREMEHASALFRGKPLYTIYVGGGTPTTLTPAQSDRLLTELERRFDLSRLKEFTVEAGRPDSVTAEKLLVLKDHGVTRISINPQTMQDKTLSFIGRRHTAEEVRAAFHLARETGSFHINMDLILGLPGESAADVAATLDEIAGLGPDDLTLHALAIKRGSRLKELMEEKGVRFPDFTDMEEASELAADRARAMGLRPYYLYRQKNIAGNFENTGYAAESAIGLYNILINEDVHSIVALGAGAISKCVRGDVITRSENVRELTQYLDRIDEMIGRKEMLYADGADGGSTDGNEQG